MEVLTKSFNEIDIRSLRRKNLIIGNGFEQLWDSLYSAFNTFDVKRLYDNGQYVGFAIIDTGHNGLLTNDISIEFIGYWGNNIPVLGEFIEYLANPDNYEYEVADIYFNSKNISESIHETFEIYGVKNATLTR